MASAAHPRFGDNDPTTGTHPRGWRLPGRRCRRVPLQHVRRRPRNHTRPGTKTQSLPVNPRACRVALATASRMMAQRRRRSGEPWLRP
jgi:hypothetical protein